MIRRSLLVFAMIVIGYAVFIKVAKVDWDTSQHQTNGNRIKAEKFVFSPDDPGATVIVGSSLSYRIVLDSLPPGTTNLGFGGLCSYDGLQLINRTKRTPARVVIESNLIFKEPDVAFLDAVFAPGLYDLRRNVPILREENQPSGIVFGWLKQRAKQARTAEEAAGDSTAMSTVLLEANRDSFAIVPPPHIQDRFLSLLEQEVASLEARGVEVVFLEVPLSVDLMPSALAVRSRTLIAERFPKHRFLRPDPAITWRTTDGLHLERHNAQRFSSWLARSLAGE